MTGQQPVTGLAAVAAEFVERPDISARSTLVTVFGDTIAPIGGEIWLGDLFELMAPFPFSERLLRTSLSRLVAEGWVTSERIGRRSRYGLTTSAQAETAEAERRIYHRPPGTWTGRWTLVIVDNEGSAESLAEHGFARLGSGLMGLPDDGTDRAAGIIAVLGAPTPPVASAIFDDPGALLRGDRITDAFGLGPVMAGYEALIARYRPLTARAGQLSGEEAFALRTMVVHELRRLRIREPHLPPGLLPKPWPGQEAHDLAGKLYHAVDDEAWVWAAKAVGPAAMEPADFATTRFRDRR